MVHSETYVNMLSMHYWYFQKSLDHFCFRQALRAAVFFYVSFFFLFLLSPIPICHYSVCYFNSSGVDSRSWIRVPTGYGVLVFQFYLLMLKYHQSFFLHLLKREDSSILHCVIHCRPEKNVSWWFLSTNLCSDDQNRFIGTCTLKLNRCKCVLCNIIDTFWICLDGDYTCLCIFIRLDGLRGKRWVLANISLMMLTDDTMEAFHVSTRK